MSTVVERGFVIDVAYDADSYDIRVSGDVAASDAHRLHDALDRALLRRPARITVDLREADTTLPALLAVLVRASRLGRIQRTEIRVITGDRLAEAIRRRGLWRWIRVVDVSPQRR